MELDQIRRVRHERRRVEQADEQPVNESKVGEEKDEWRTGAHQSDGRLHAVVQFVEIRVQAVVTISISAANIRPIGLISSLLQVAILGVTQGWPVL